MAVAITSDPADRVHWKNGVGDSRVGESTKIGATIGPSMPNADRPESGHPAETKSKEEAGRRTNRLDSRNAYGPEKPSGRKDRLGSAPRAIGPSIHVCPVGRKPDARQHRERFRSRFLHDGGAMILDCPLAYAQTPCDGLTPMAGKHQVHDLLLPRGQTRDPSSGIVAQCAELARRFLPC